MKAFIFGLVFFITVTPLYAQLSCATQQYKQQRISNTPGLSSRIQLIEEQLKETQDIQLREMQGIIKIPVVFHILYHYPEQKVSDVQVINQLAALNRDFRRRNPDSSNTPAYFKPVAADMEIEFVLATSDPRQRSTTGILKKYSPIIQWGMDDKMKFSGEMGDNGWDPRSYLNIWVCDLKGLAGYSSILGGPENLDGIVIDFEAFGTAGSHNLGRTLVHEVGHWLGLKHIWGDADCGDDGVNDTPKQSFYTAGCPTGIRITCVNGPYGNMYMNYMDFTNDACMNLFTEGQKHRMRALFSIGGVRNSLLSSNGLDQPMIHETVIPETDPRWLHPKVFPIPVSTELTFDLSYDIRWIGKTINITNLNGQSLMKVQIKNKVQQIDLSRLQPGVYFLNAVKEDGAQIKEKIIKL